MHFSQCNAWPLLRDFMNESAESLCSDCPYHCRPDPRSPPSTLEFNGKNAYELDIDRDVQEQRKAADVARQDARLARDGNRGHWGGGGLRRGKGGARFNHQTRREWKLQKIQQLMYKMESSFCLDLARDEAGEMGLDKIADQRDGYCQ